MTSSSLAAIKTREESLLCHTYGRYPLSAARAQGSRLWDLDGREYVDLLSGIAVTSLGHCNEELALVMAEQARKLVHVSNLFYQEEQLDLAQRLLDLSHCEKAFFCNSGAEANEAMIKLARRYMKRVRNSDAFEILTLKGAFHGRTLATLAATGQPKYQDGFDPLPEGFVQVPWGDLAALEAAVTPRTAAIMAEMVQGESGIHPMSPDYARGIEALCRKHGLLLLVDEVQSGMYRTGRPWAFQHFDIRPDIVSCAKALANGLPMGAIMATSEVAQAFTPGMHATTFGGSALVSAVACKVLDIMRRDRLDERAARLGEAFMSRLRDVATRLPGRIREVRGRGLMIGVELAFPGHEVWAALLDRGFVLNLAHERVLRLLPALTIDEADLNAFVAALEDVLTAVPAEACHAC